MFFLEIFVYTFYCQYYDSIFLFVYGVLSDRMVCLVWIGQFVGRVRLFC